MPTPLQTRTALFGLERFLKKKPTTPPATPDRRERTRAPALTTDDAVAGAYFYVPKETVAFDVTGRPYPEKIKGNTSVEATGRVKDDRIEIRYKSGRVWMRIQDLHRPLQSRKASKSPEAAYESARTLPEIFRILLDGEGPQALKTGAKVKAAIAAMEAIVRKACAGYSYQEGDVGAFVATLVPDAMKQKQGFAEVADSVKNRSRIAADIVDTKTMRSANAHVADMFILAAALHALRLKGDTKARAKFVLDTVAPLVTRAGGTGLQTQLVDAVRVAVPWKDATKMRQQRGLEASVKTANVTDMDVINAFSEARPLPTTGTYHDLVFDWLRKNGPQRGWDELSKSEDALIILTATPKSVGTRTSTLERSKQLLEFIADMEARLTRDHNFANVYAPQAENATLAQLLDAATDPVTALLLTQLVPHATWYNQLVVKGRPNGDMQAAYALYALAWFRAASLEEHDGARAAQFISGMSALVRFRLIQPAMLLTRLRFFFPWTTVSSMLRYRMG